MQIYVPTPDFTASAEALKTTHLVEQVDDTLTILSVFHETVDIEPWEGHPLLRMWKSYEAILATFGQAMIEEVQARRTHKAFPADSLRRLVEKEELMAWHLECAASGDFKIAYPKWWGDDNLHHSHRSALLRRDPVYYSNVFHGVPMDLPEFWPVA